MMEHTELVRCADLNRVAFDEALPSYVALKLSQVTSALERGERTAWLDASGCVWCIFDDRNFLRSGDEARAARESCADDFGFCIWWSFGDVVMPDGCDERWVAGRIVEEALRQLPELGLRGRPEERTVDGATHAGVRITRPLLQRLKGASKERPS